MIRSPWRRRAEIAPLVDVHHNGSGVVPRTLTAAEKDWVAALPAGLPAAWVPEYQRVSRKAHQLGRGYGRASATIHALRGEAALLRERIGELLIDVDDAKSQLDYSRGERDKLADALYAARPPIRSGVLGPLIRDAWFGASDRLTDAQRWERVAETAIDAVRGLWPGELPAADVAVLDGEADRRIAWDELKPGDPAPLAQTDGLECMAPVTSARSGLTLCCSRTDGHAGQHVACGMDTVYDVAPADADARLGEQALDAHEALARAIFGVTTKTTGLTWEAATEDMRAAYRAWADAVVLAGWRPPATTTRDERTAAVAQVVRAHRYDPGTARPYCICGWPEFGGLGGATRHAHHVAEQLAATGVLT